MKQTILGSGGAIGIELAKALNEFTSDIRLVSRKPSKINQTDELFPADLTRREDVFNAIAGSEIVYVTLGFPYNTKVWQKLWPAFMKNVPERCEFAKHPNASSSYSRCIVIHANGTYEYSAEGSISGYGGDYYGGSSSQLFDRGTWKLAGNQIYVQSEKEGSKVYSFEKRNHPKNNDPMIVIDGDMYVTYYQKAPW